jgi:hypothetical protein
MLLPIEMTLAYQLKMLCIHCVLTTVLARNAFKTAAWDKECTFLKTFHIFPRFSPEPGAATVLFHNLRVKSRHFKTYK